MRRPLRLTYLISKLGSAIPTWYAHPKTVVGYLILQAISNFHFVVKTVFVTRVVDSWCKMWYVPWRTADMCDVFFRWCFSDDLTVLLREIMQEARNLTKAERYVRHRSVCSYDYIVCWLIADAIALLWTLYAWFYGVVTIVVFMRFMVCMCFAGALCFLLTKKQKNWSPKCLTGIYRKNR